jgi:hypothetical protein
MPLPFGHHLPEVGGRPPGADVRVVADNRSASMIVPPGTAIQPRCLRQMNQSVAALISIAPGFRRLLDQQEGIAVHRRRDVGEHLDRIPELTHGGEHVHRHALRRRAGKGGLFALRTLRDALRAQLT